MNSQRHMEMAPQISKVRRPSFSTIQNEAGVVVTLTIFMMVDIRNGL